MKCILWCNDTGAGKIFAYALGVCYGGVSEWIAAPGRSCVSMLLNSRRLSAYTKSRNMSPPRLARFMVRLFVAVDSFTRTLTRESALLSIPTLAGMCNIHAHALSRAQRQLHDLHHLATDIDSRYVFESFQMSWKLKLLSIVVVCNLYWIQAHSSFTDITFAVSRTRRLLHPNNLLRNSDLLVVVNGIPFRDNLLKHILGLPHVRVICEKAICSPVEFI